MFESTTSTPPAAGVLSRLTAACAVGAAWVLLQLVGLGAAPFHSKGEPREAVVVQDLVQRGDWVLPRRNGVELPRKPPLFYWLGAIAARSHGAVTEATVRLPSAVQSGAATVLLALVATALYGLRAGLVSGAALLTSFEWLRAATSARVDMTLTFGLALCFFGLLLFRRQERSVWLLMLYTGMLWATLSKGIPGLAIPLLQIAALCLVDRSPAFLRRLRLVRGLVLVVLAVGAWYALAAAAGGSDFVTIVVRENFVRAVGEPIGLGHEHSAAYLLGTLLLGLLPWTVFLPGVAASLWGERAAVDRRDPRLFALIWIVAVFAPYAVATSKRGVYLLPIYPAICLLLGWWATVLGRGEVRATRLGRLLSPLGWVLAGVAGLLAVTVAAEAAGVPLLDAVAGAFDPRTAADLRLVAVGAAAHGTAMAALFAAAAAGALTLALCASRGRWDAALTGMFVAVGTVAATVRLFILPALSDGLTRRPFVEAVRRAVGDPSRLFTTPRFDYGTVYYWGAPIPAYGDALQANGPPFVLLLESQWRRLRAVERRWYRPVPGVRVERGNNQGYVVLLQRIAPLPTDETGAKETP